jgi:DNA-binding transcriptional MerR regulator
MKPQELAKRLNIADVTLRKWAREDYAEFLSPSAQSATKSGRRSFSDQDVRVLTWIAQLRDDNTSPDEIRTTLRSAQQNDWRDLPPFPATTGDEITLVPREAVEERFKALQERFDLQVQALVNERDALATQLSASRAENAELRARLDNITDRLLSLLEKK